MDPRRFVAGQPAAGEPPTVLVLDGEQRAALAVVRSIGRYGCRVHVGSATSKSLAGGSRYVRTESILPNPLEEPEAYCRAVADLALRSEASIVLPVSEPSILALLERPALIRDMWAQVPLPDLAHFQTASDKASVLALADSLGVPVPPQWAIPERAAPAPDIPAEHYPVVIKPFRSIVTGSDGRLKLGVAYAYSPAQLASILSGLIDAAYPVLVQARIEGPGLGIFMLRWDGKTVATFAHRRIREKPPSGGVSVCCESVAAPKELLEQSARLLSALDWSGVAMVEFKLDTRSGKTYLMEINPRFWGSLQLAVDAGVDFPIYLLRLATGLPVARVDSWRVGARLKWEFGELDHLLTRIRRSRLELDLPKSAPGLLKTVFAIMNLWLPHQRLEVFRLQDPLPAFREVRHWLRALW